MILALGTIESTRLALASFPTSNNPAEERMGRNLISHVRSNIYLRVRRSALDSANALPLLVQKGAVLVRGSIPQGKFQIQVTASADAGFNSDALLFSMVPDIDQLDMLLKSQRARWISFAFRGVSQMHGDRTASVPNASGQIVSQGRDAVGTTYHKAGTLGMGADATSSVTDVNGRFHHVDNAFCPDQSLFVTVGSVNPTLTGLTLSQKVAQAVVARATGSAPPP